MRLKGATGLVFRFISLVATFVLLLAVPAIGAKVIPGSPCSQVNKKELYKGRLFTCIKLGSKKYWNNGSNLIKASLFAYARGESPSLVTFSVAGTSGDKCTVSAKKGWDFEDFQEITLKKGIAEGVFPILTAGGMIELEADCKYSGTDYFSLKINEVKPAPSPSISKSPTPTQTPTPTPTATSNSSSNSLPTSGITYWGKYFYEKCWFAKQFRNNGNTVTLAAQQRIEIISTDGTVSGYKIFHVPSLQPRQSMWLAEWSLDNQCRSTVGKVNESPIEKRNFFASPLWNRMGETGLSEIPSILSVVTIPGKFPNTSIYKLKIRNNSIDKYLDTNTSEGTRISFVFLNAQGIPIFAVAGRTMEKVPPLGEATLTAWDFEIGSIELPPGTSTIEPGLIFELCKSYTCNY